MNRPCIAYYAAEYAVDDNLPIYAGGLGVLASDVVLEAAAQKWPLVAFGAAYRAVSSAQSRRGKGARRFEEAGFTRLAGRGGKPFEAVVDFGGWSVKVGAWQRRFGRTRLILIDTNVRGNSDLNRKLTANLYEPDLVTRLLQEFVLARASIAVLDHLRIVPDRYHLNEGHMAFVPLVLAARYREAYGPMPLAKAIARVRERVVGTKHTILSAAGDFADEATLERLFGGYLGRSGWTARDLLELGVVDGDGRLFSTTALMIRASRVSSAVSRLHAAAEHRAHRTSLLVPITNGVHLRRWQSPNLRRAVDSLTDRQLWDRHSANRAELVKFVNGTLGTRLDPELLTMVWARRFAPYKRPTLAFSDVPRLQRLMAGNEGFQLVLSGNANEIDEEGVRFLEQIVAHAQDPGFAGRMVYLPHYATDVARRLAMGADVWLNTPVRGMEASGTSGMKAGLNGALQLSTIDGWIDEVDLGKIGWKLPNGDTAAALYRTIEQRVLPAFYARDSEGLPHAWLARMRAVMRLCEAEFTSARMLEDYRTKLYRV
jgi:alpha-glucan phosphorylase-like protein